MATQHVYDMLAVDRQQLSQETSGLKPTSTPKVSKAKRIPKGMSRELYSIMAVDGDLPEMYTVVPSNPPTSDNWKKTIHRDKKRRARKWIPTSFSPKPDPGAEKFLKHWGKVEDVDKDYPFWKLAPHTYTEPITLPTFTSTEYRLFPQDPNNVWSEDATRHLMELVSKFDMRFEVIQYFWDAEKFGKKDCVDLRARFTEVYNLLLKIRGDKRQPLPPYDAASERKRRLQLDRLQMRTQEEIDENIALKEQERKITTNREERERRQGVMQMRLNDFNRTLSEPRAAGRSVSQIGDKGQVQKKSSKKSSTAIKKGDKRKSLESSVPHLTISEPNLKFPEIKTAGAWARSMRLKLPNSVTSKKAIALKAMLTELKLDEHPMADEEAIDEFNKLRADLLLLYELKSAMVTAAADLTHIRAELGDNAKDPQIAGLLERAEAALKQSSGEKLISDRIDATPSSSSTRFRRKTTVEQIRTQKAPTTGSQAE